MPYQYSSEDLSIIRQQYVGNREHWDDFFAWFETHIPPDGDEMNAIRDKKINLDWRIDGNTGEGGYVAIPVI